MHPLLTVTRSLLVLGLLLPLAPTRAAAADTPAAAATTPATPPSATPAKTQEAKVKATARPKVKVRAGMVTVAGGAFFMGCNEEVDYECFGDEKPGRMVEVATFEIDQKEVSVASSRAASPPRRARARA
jgi:formylglycine-generating enzyme required for sulfatase activity